MDGVWACRPHTESAWHCDIRSLLTDGNQGVDTVCMLMGLMLLSVLKSKWPHYSVSMLVYRCAIVSVNRYGHSQWTWYYRRGRKWRCCGEARSPIKDFVLIKKEIPRIWYSLPGIRMVWIINPQTNLYFSLTPLFVMKHTNLWILLQNKSMITNHFKITVVWVAGLPVHR